MGQKRFKITEIEKYQNQLSREKKETVKKTFLFGLSAIAALCSFTVFEMAKGTISTLGMLFGVANTVFSIYRLKDLMETIRKKVMLKNNLDVIYDEQEMHRCKKKVLDGKNN